MSRPSLAGQKNTRASYILTGVYDATSERTYLTYKFGLSERCCAADCCYVPNSLTSTLGYGSRSPRKDTGHLYVLDRHS